MGKAAVDLPELEAEAPATASAGTDDLLAQLAGQEIDRLLAEADVDRPPVSSTPASIPSPATIEPQTTPQGAERPAAQATPPVEPHHKLLPDLDAPRAEQAIGDLVAPLDPELEEATREISASAERLGLDLALGPAAEQLAADDAAIDLSGEQPSLPAILRPLQWLEACCDSIPEGLLETAGKIGILTTVNAIAVLIYVLFFRHH